MKNTTIEDKEMLDLTTLYELKDFVEEQIKEIETQVDAGEDFPRCDYQGRVLSVPEGWLGDLYCLYADGECSEVYGNEGFTRGCLYSGSLFIDEESAEAEVIRRQVTQRARGAAYSDGWRPDWTKYKQKKYYVKEKQIAWTPNVVDGHLQVWFESEEKTRAFLNTMTEEEHAALNYEWKG